MLVKMMKINKLINHVYFLRRMGVFFVVFLFSAPKIYSVPIFVKASVYKSVLYKHVL